MVTFGIFIILIVVLVNIITIKYMNNKCESVATSDSVLTIIKEEVCVSVKECKADTIDYVNRVSRDFTNMNKTLKAKVDSLENRIETRVDNVEKRIESKVADMGRKLNNVQNIVNDMTDIESQPNKETQTAKEKRESKKKIKKENNPPKDIEVSRS